jgi:hypothetical protein
MNKLAALLTPIPCAVLFCLINACKPAVIDDLAYLWYARQIVQTPAEPFGPPPDGFKLIWYDRGQGAFSLLTPMIVPYWLALGLLIIGENLVLLKLWLFPFCLLFTTSVYALLRRFAPGFERPLLALTVFSPAILPSLNLMVDVPALAVGLAAIALFLSGLDDRRTCWGRIVAAGLLAGLAAQTKYTGLTASAVIILAAVLRGRLLAGLAALMLALAVFAGWEAYLAHVYGRSHFLLQLDKQRAALVGQDGAAGGIGAQLQSAVERKIGLTVPLVGILGGVAAALIPLFLLALRWRRGWVIATMALIALGFVLMALLPESMAVFYRNSRQIRDEVSVSTIVVGANGILVVLLLAVTIGYLGFRGWSRLRIRFRGNAVSWFLIGWLIIELGSYFVLSPFAAVRRVLGIYVIATLLAGRLMHLTCRAAERRRLLNPIVGFGIALGLLFAWTDYRDAAVEKRALLDSVAWIRGQPDANRPVWFCGHWGFHYYAEHVGLKPIFPGESMIGEGDWIIYPDTLLRPYGQLVLLEPEWAEKMIVIEWFDSWPLRTNPEFYDSYQPIRHHEGHRLRVTIFRAKKKFPAQPV